MFMNMLSVYVLICFFLRVLASLRLLNWYWNCPTARVLLKWPSRTMENRPNHYSDVIMTTMASQITSHAVVFSIVYSDADQRKHQSSASLAFVRGDGWIPRTKGQWREKCFHLMKLSWATNTGPPFMLIEMYMYVYSFSILNSKFAFKHNPRVPKLFSVMLNRVPHSELCRSCLIQLNSCVPLILWQLCMSRKIGWR